MFSIYTSLYHIEKHSFPWRESLENFVQFAGDDSEVVVAVNKSEDNTLAIIKEFAAQNPTVKIVETNYSYDNIEMDGLIKNAALQACTKEIRIQMDADEAFYLPSRPKWVQYAEELLKSNIECLMLPTVDCFGAKDKIRADKNVGLKFRMHKKGLTRGVWKEAKRGDKINTSMSDTCELLRPNGDLAISSSIVSQTLLYPIFVPQLKDFIWTYHFGYLSFDQRVNINKKLWKSHWELRSGKREEVVTDIFELANVPTVAHNLPLN
jgi:glycosyltransferase involved in cell wall biosynthesis